MWILLSVRGHIVVLKWYMNQENGSYTNPFFRGFKSRKYFFILFTYWSKKIKKMWDMFKCFSLFGLIHILLDTEKLLSEVVAYLMFEHVPPSRWHQHTCQRLHMWDSKRCFLLEGKGSAKDSIKPSTRSLQLYAHTQRLAARENN